MNLECSACGKKFRSMTAEAKHRHNFPALCARNRRFIAWSNELSAYKHGLERAAVIAETYAIPAHGETALETVTREKIAALIRLEARR
jgi:hypothetical protein